MKKTLFQKRFSYFDLAGIFTIVGLVGIGLWWAIPAVLIIGAGFAVLMEDD